MTTRDVRVVEDDRTFGQAPIVTLENRFRRGARRGRRASRSADRRLDHSLSIAKVLTTAAVEMQVQLHRADELVALATGMLLTAVISSRSSESPNSSNRSKSSGARKTLNWLAR